MSLLTPPSTAHRRAKDKENLDCHNPRVVWSETNKIHVLQLTLSAPKVPTASRRPPTKSILKKPPTTSSLLVPWPQEKTRDVTPEPADPLVNLRYLEYPVATIVKKTTELRGLIEAYSVLMARLRTCVTGGTDVDASWPLFQPLRKNREAFVEAVVRDLGRALVDPATFVPKGEEKEKKEEAPVRVGLPSPKSTPKKKRDGMSAEQVKFARDLCTTSHAVIRMLSVVFTLPAVINIFTDAQLGLILTAVLAIPLSDELPTPNARKTWALAIWLIQMQRLPAEVLAPAADRIANALCRGIEGELGKEGKKGSASDGLKAIHDLSTHLPTVFIPAFTPHLLPAVLRTLLAPTLALRTYAAHALGGFVWGATRISRSGLHVRMAGIVGEFVTTPSPPRVATTTPTKTNLKTASPTKSASSLDPAIIRTLRTVLQATEVAHVAQGPVWGTCVLASLLVLLGPEAVGGAGAGMRGVMGLGLRHRNKAVRALGSVLWRVVIWVFLQPPFPLPVHHHDDEGEDGGEGRKREERVRRGREEWWRLVGSVTEYETGVCTLAAYVGSTNVGVPLFEAPRYKYLPGRDGGEGEEERLRRGMDVLYAMVCKDAATCSSAIDTMRALVGAPPSSSSPSASPSQHEHEQGDSRRTLLPQGLFSALPGLLSTEYGALKASVNPLFEETPKAEDVRCLTGEEVGRAWVWEGLVRAWRGALGGGDGGGGGGSGERGERERERGELVGVWEGMVGMGLAAVLDKDRDGDADFDVDAEESGHDVDAVAEFTLRAVDVIITLVLEDANLDLAPPKTKTQRWRGLDIPGFPASSSSSSSALAKLAYARELWSVMCRVVPHAMLGDAAERLGGCLIGGVGEYTAFTGSSVMGVEDQNGEEGEGDGEETNEMWAKFCVDVVAVWGGDGVRAFWGYDERSQDQKKGWTQEEKAGAWRVFVRGWMQQGSAATWEGAVAILGVPFVSVEKEGWALTSEDAKAWQELLEHAVATALDYGHDAGTVLFALTALVSSESRGYLASQIRLVEFVSMHLAGVAARGELRELPEGVLEFVGGTMGKAYPPPLGGDQTTYTWAARAVAGLVEVCPGELVRGLGEAIGEAVGVWVGDAEGRWEGGVVEYDILPMYQTMLVAVQCLPLDPGVLGTFGGVLCAPFAGDARGEIREMAVESFREFWEATYKGVQAPEGGWGEEVGMCLEAVYGAPEQRPKLEAAFVPRPSTPILSDPTTIHTVPTTPTSSSRFSVRQTANTLSTPPRLHKSSRMFPQLPPHSPESPVPASRVSRPPTPRANRTPWGSPTKRRKLVHGDKENLSPVRERVIPSVLERIGVLSSPRVALGKRRFEEETGDSEEERSVRRSLVEAEASDDDVFLVAPPKKRTVEVSRGVKALHLLEDKPTPTPTPERKRKRMVLDAVEVSRISDLYPRRLRASVSFEERPVVCTPSMVTRSMRRTTSETNLRGVVDSSGSRKRRRRSSSSGDEEEEESSSSPLQAFRRPSSQRQYKKLQLEVRLPSSDDDPHIGQVTPHHLISPGLRRGASWGCGDPGSDDSVMAPSPSRDLVNRRLQRLGSVTALNVNVKPFVV